MTARALSAAKGERRRRTALANVRLLPEERAAIEETARRDGTSIGNVIYRALIATRALEPRT